MRKNSRARPWVAKRIERLRKKGLTSEAALILALQQGSERGLMNPTEADELKDEIEAAEELARGFHGRENRESYEVDEHEVYRENLAVIGNLLDMEVLIIQRADEGLITLPFEDVMLSCSSDRKQLYLVGDTSLPDEWLQQSCPSGWDKDKVNIGYDYSIAYHTDKHHLTGPKSQAKGEGYTHCFGEQTYKAPGKFEGVWKLPEKLAAGLLPQVIYNRLSGGMELVGGSYEVRDEGIWD